jgi:AcrR family transcriptional regulator
MPASTRERLIHAADDMFYRDGFHAVGLDRILSEVGVTKTTFYNHFESKESLILEVLRVRDRWWREEFPSLLRKHGGEDPASQLQAIFDVLEELFAAEEFNGCIFINVAVEFPMPHDPVHVAAMEHKHIMELLLRDLALRAAVSDPVRFAEELALIMEGAFVTRQVTRNDQTLQIARRLGESLFERYLNVPHLAR